MLSFDTLTISPPPLTTSFVIHEGAFLHFFKEGPSLHFDKVALLIEKRFLDIGSAICKLLEDRNIPTLLLPMEGGEKVKCRSTKEKVETDLFSFGIDRKSALFAIGGGSLLDLGGYIAAHYMRGIPWIGVPTTLLAMIDASIGGKTAINTEEGKNLIGAFHPPLYVISDLLFLSTLPNREWRSALSESIKSSLINDEALFKALEAPSYETFPLKKSLLETVVKRSVAIKTKIVKEDPFDQGMRALLNFGHTIGHSVEWSEKEHLSHGEAIAIGMIVESFISFKMSLLPFEDFRRIEMLIRKVHPHALTIRTRLDDIQKRLLLDKKGQDDVRVTLLKGIGDPLVEEGTFSFPIKETLLEEALDWMMERFGPSLI